MPYRHAHYYVLVVIAVIVAGFWPSYFSVWGSAPWQFHAHGVAAGLWVTMVAAQSWTAQHRQLPLHRAVGKASLLLFPFLIGGLAAIIDVTAKGFVAGDGPVRIMFGGSFLIGLALAIAAYVTVYYRALKYRRKVWVHAGYMLTTPLILFESPFSRLLNGFMPGLVIGGPDDFGLIMPSILWAMAIELAVIAAIWLRYREKANPFLVAAGFIAAQMLTMGLMADSAPLKSLLAAIGQAPSAAVVLSGFAIGALTSWAGWRAGKRPAVPVAEAVQPA
ncbi:MAG: hypothetical protein QOG13_378 [Sphingomonadales bacterium]|jgi:hypothetical protein|nr:hypothetical protein [Sphingomonadales bacterium]